MPSTREIAEAVRKWQERVVYDVAFKNPDAPYIEKLTTILRQSMSRFTLIAANSEALVYKIGRFFIENGISNENVSIIDGKIVESYLKEGPPEWKLKDRVDDLVSIFKSDLTNKWLFVPCLEFKISIGVALYFITKVKQCGCIGIVWYASGPDNMTEILVHGMTSLPDFYQFPKPTFYSARRKQLPEDEW